MSVTEVPSTGLAIPEPQAIASLSQVYDLCDRVDPWVDSCSDMAALRDADARLAAFDVYLAQTSKNGRARIVASRRRLEVRIGILLGPTRTGERHDLEPSLASEGSTLTPNERSAFRKMAEHPDVVERVIAESTDADPPSRRKILNAIDQTASPDPAPCASTSRRPQKAQPDKSSAAVAERRERIAELARAGHTSEQIASQLGLTRAGVKTIARERCIDIPADAVIAHNRRPETNRILDGIVTSSEIPPTLLELIDYSAVDPDRIDDWVASLKRSIRSLTTIRDRLKELNR